MSFRKSFRYSSVLCWLFKSWNYSGIFWYCVALFVSLIGRQPLEKIISSSPGRLEDKDQCNPGSEGYEAEEVCTGVYTSGENGAVDTAPTSTKRYVLTFCTQYFNILSISLYLSFHVSGSFPFQCFNFLSLPTPLWPHFLLPDTEYASVTTGSTSTDVMDLPLISTSVTVKQRNLRKGTSCDEYEDWRSKEFLVTDNFRISLKEREREISYRCWWKCALYKIMTIHFPKYVSHFIYLWCTSNNEGKEVKASSLQYHFSEPGTDRYK